MSTSTSVVDEAGPMEVEVQDVQEIFEDAMELEIPTPLIENYETDPGE